MKIFGIGLSRTGTTSLTHALRKLGFSARHFPESLDEVLRYDALTDTPIAAGYRFLDLMFPGAKFILTDRAAEDWLRSCESYWGKFLVEQTSVHQRLHHGLYRSIRFDREKFRTARQQHLAAVREYFAPRPRDLLELRICEGEGWEPLCAFLERPVPPDPFPHANQLD